MFGYVPLDVGMKYGLFAKQGLEIEEIVFTGGAKLTQALTAGALDIALSGGAEMAFIAKGAPEIAIAFDHRLAGLHGDQRRRPIRPRAVWTISKARRSA